MKLSEKSERMMARLSKHYPFQGEQSNSVHSTPSQHLHDYRKVKFILSQQREIYDKSTSEKLQNMLFFKQEGNNHYKNGRFREASYFYQKVIVYGDYTFPEEEGDTYKMGELLQQANCNLALSLIKLGEWEKVKMHLNQAAKGSSVDTRIKALYWLTKYHIKHSEFQQADRTIQQLRDINPPPLKNIDEVSRELSQSINLSQAMSKRVCQNMFKE